MHWSYPRARSGAPGGPLLRWEICPLAQCCSFSQTCCNPTAPRRATTESSSRWVQVSARSWFWSNGELAGHLFLLFGTACVRTRARARALPSKCSAGVRQRRGGGRSPALSRDGLLSYLVFLFLRRRGTRPSAAFSGPDRRCGLPRRNWRPGISLLDDLHAEGTMECAGDRFSQRGARDFGAVSLHAPPELPRGGTRNVLRPTRSRRLDYGAGVFARERRIAGVSNSRRRKRPGFPVRRCLRGPTATSSEVSPWHLPLKKRSWRRLARSLRASWKLRVRSSPTTD